MSVTVIIPVFNGARFLPQTLASVRTQERAPDRVLVVDDQSTDDSLDVARRHPDVDVIENPEKGAGHARNRGIQEADTETIAFLDQDDLWHPAHLRLALAALETDTARQAVFASVVSFPDGRVPVLSEHPPDVTAVDPWTRFPTHSPIRTSSAAVIRRAALERVGAYDNAFTGAGDYFVWLKLALMGPLAQIAAGTVGRREHAGSQVKALREDGQRYLDVHLAATAKALAWRRDHTAEDAAALAHRQDVACAVRDVARSVSNGESADVETSALEAQLHESDEALLFDVFHLLVRTLVPSPDEGTYRRGRFELFARLHASLPPGTRSRRALLRYAALKRWPIGRFLRALVRLDGDALAYLIRLLGLKLVPRPA